MKGHDHQALDVREARVPVRPIGEYADPPRSRGGNWLELNLPVPA